MRTARLLVVALALAGCKAKPPPVSPALKAALAKVDATYAVGVDREACRALGEELTTWSHASLGMNAGDASQLAREVMVGCESESGIGNWPDVKKRIDRVLAGKKPVDGPRYHLDMPPEVQAAMDDADRALASGDAQEAAAAIGRARGRIAMWAEKMPPGARVQRMLEEADRPTFGGDIASLRAEWAQTKKRIQPGAE